MEVQGRGLQLPVELSDAPLPNVFSNWGNKDRVRFFSIFILLSLPLTVKFTKYMWLSEVLCVWYG